MISRCDRSEVLELVEKAFDEVSLSTDSKVDGVLHLSVFLGGDVSGGAVVFNELKGGQRSVDQVAYTLALSDAYPGASTKRNGSPLASARAWILVFSPPRDRPVA